MSACSARGLRLCLSLLLLPMIVAPPLLAQARRRSVQLMHSYPASQRRREPLLSNPRGQAALNLLSYYGGPVMSNVEVLAIFWTSQVDSGEQINAPGFYSSVTNSPWMDLLSQYSTAGLTGVTGHAGSNQTIGRGNFGGSYTITPANTNTNLTDADIQTELLHQINIGALPMPQLDGSGNPNTLYMTYFPPGYHISLPGGFNSCVSGGFCAYHGTLTLNSELVPYSVIPDQSPGSGCSIGCGNDHDYINNLDSTCSHELAESVTDAAVGIGITIDYPLAWYDPNPDGPSGTGGEIGDICDTFSAETTTGGLGQTYTVQLLWSNRDGGCVAFTPNSTQTALALGSSELPQAKFRQLRLTATVSSQLGPVTEGSVVFSDGGTPFANALLNASGKAIHTGGLSVGRHLITAHFASSSSYSASTSNGITQYQSPRPR